MPEPRAEFDQIVSPARCWCGDAVTIHDDGSMCCGTEMFHDPSLPPLDDSTPPAEEASDA